MSGVFGGAQAIYADHGIATFPVTQDKQPAIKGYLKIGLRGSGQLATRSHLANAPALGIVCGQKISLVDVDTHDERVLAQSLDDYSPTPIISRTASGGYHLWYGANGERRQVRPRPGVLIDILGRGGFAIVPPSMVAKGRYEFIRGSLNDLDRLPVMRDPPPPVVSKEAVLEGKRNETLWRMCMRETKHVKSFNELLRAAHALNQEYLVPPLDDGDVVNIAQSAWSYEEKGLNHFGQHGAWISGTEYDELLSQPDGFVVIGVLNFLRRHQGPWAEFMCVNEGVAQRLGCAEKRVAAARRKLVELGYIKPTRQAGRGTPALFVWAPKKGRSYD